MEPYKKFRANYIETKDILKQAENEYFVLVYWTTCPHCFALVSDATRYLENKKSKNKLYLLDFTGEKDDLLFKETVQNEGESKLDFIARYEKDSIGATNVKDINYYYVPMLIHVMNKKVVNTVVLEDKISLYFKIYEE
jgi:hypothetical protein